jgi:hypothetical protein
VREAAKCGDSVMAELPTSRQQCCDVGVPTVHLTDAEIHLPITDELLRLRDFPADAGGAGQVMPD